MVIRWVFDSIKTEKTAIVAQAVIVGIEIFPCPILGTKLAIGEIALGDVIALVVRLHANKRSFRIGGTYMYGQKDIGTWSDDVFVA